MLRLKRMTSTVDTMFTVCPARNPTVDISVRILSETKVVGVYFIVRDSTSPYRKFLPTDPNGLTVDNWQFKVRLTDIYDIPVTLLVRTRS